MRDAGTEIFSFSGFTHFQENLFVCLQFVSQFAHTTVAFVLKAAQSKSYESFAPCIYDSIINTIIGRRTIASLVVVNYPSFELLNSTQLIPSSHLKSTFKIETILSRAESSGKSSEEKNFSRSKFSFNFFQVIKEDQRIE